MGFTYWGKGAWSYLYADNVLSTNLHIDMKKNYLLLLSIICISAFSCSKSSDEEPPANLEMSDGFDKDGIGYNWSNDDFTFDRYYTKVNIFPDVPQLSPRVGVLYDEGNSITVSWVYNGGNIENVEEHTTWNADKQKWLSVNKPDIDSDYQYKFGDRIRVNIQYSNGEFLYREQTIKENKLVRDVLGVNFGMTKREVINNEQKRVNKECVEYLPNTLMLPNSTNIKNGITTTIYKFKDDKLVEVGEYAYHIHQQGVLNQYVVNYCKSLGLSEIPEIVADENLEKNYTWSNSNILFTLSIIDDAPNNTRSNTLRAFGISYKLK